MKKVVILFLCVLTVSLITAGCSIQEHSSSPAKPPLSSEENSGAMPSPSPEGNAGKMPPPPPGGMQEEPDDYASVVTIEENDERSDERSDESIISLGKDENAIHIASGTVHLKDMDIERTSKEGEESDAYSFFGIGAAVLSTGGNLFFYGGNIETDAIGGAGLFAYKDGIITAEDFSLNPKQSNLRIWLHRLRRLPDLRLQNEILPYPTMSMKE